MKGKFFLFVIIVGVSCEQVCLTYFVVTKLRLHLTNDERLTLSLDRGG